MINNQGPFIHNNLTKEKMKKFYLISLLPITFYATIRNGNFKRSFLILTFAILVFSCLLYLYNKLNKQTIKLDYKEFYPVTTILLCYLLYPLSLPWFFIAIPLFLYFLFRLLFFKYSYKKIGALSIAVLLSLLLFHKLGYNTTLLFFKGIGTSIFTDIIFYTFPTILGFIFLFALKSVKWKVPIVTFITLLFASLIIGIGNHSIITILLKFLTSQVLFVVLYLETISFNTPVSGVGSLLYGMFLGLLIMFLSLKKLPFYPSLLAISILPLTSSIFDYISSFKAPAIKKIIIPILIFLILFVILISNF